MGHVPIGDRIIVGERLALIAGPCVIEDESMVLKTAGRLRTISSKLGLPFVFKSSYSKENRSSISSYSGPGIDEGLRILNRVKTEENVPVLSDVHCREEVKKAAEVLDVLQVPAFLSRQTPLLLACARTGKPVNVKKGQFIAPQDMALVVEKIESVGGKKILLTERGTFFGYGNLVVDMRSIPIMKRFGYPVVFDVTHSLQLPGGKEAGGSPSFALPLAKAAVACGADALFIETHPDPPNALSDRTTMIPLDKMEEFLGDVLRVRNAL
ncbi:MAG: 3-deoxy-8-phosphooctulonate synthase [Candidatus Eisenbacteria bacterium]|nr:3-deoxy-8-phosphooctulonate synthase [Candidatus Eisenbacteria bacterium]